MTKLTVYDPAMCCATGICGAEVDQKLVDLAADLDWLRAQGVEVQRFGLSREPGEFMANPSVRAIMEESGGDDLPAFLVNGVLKAKGRYPARAELAAWTGVAGPAAGLAGDVRELIALGAAVAAGCEPCLRHHVQKSRDVGLTDAQMREAIAVGRLVKDAAARNILALADRLVPEAAATEPGPADAAPAAACCGGNASPAPAREKAGGCC